MRSPIKAQLLAVAGKGAQILELCGGVGVLGLSLAKRLDATLLSTDVNPESGELFKVNAARLLPAESYAFAALSAERALCAQQVAGLNGRAAEVLILDPPRRGLGCQTWRSGRPAGQQEAEAIRSSTVRVVIYMSCGPRSFMQDAERLTSPGATPAFRLTWLRLYDMFPFTEHIETLSIFVRDEVCSASATGTEMTWKPWEEMSFLQEAPAERLERGRYQCQFLVGIEDPEFQVVGRILGRGGANMKRIAGKTNAKMRLRGRGSGFKEADLDGQVAPEQQRMVGDPVWEGIGPQPGDVNEVAAAKKKRQAKTQRVRIFLYLFNFKLASAEAIAPLQKRLGCKDLTEVCDAIVSGTLTVLMACIIIPLGIPAFLVVFTLAGMGQVYDKPDEISEECNRDVDGRTEALRGQGACPNYAHHVRNNHPVFGIFCCDRGHPFFGSSPRFSPVERFGLLVLLVSRLVKQAVLGKDGSFKEKGFGYFMAGLKMSFGGYLHKNHYHWNDMNLTWILLDCHGGLWSLLDCDCCKKCCESMAVFKACQDGCEDGHNQAVNGIFAGLFAGLAFAGSCAFVIFGVRMDMDASEDVWSTFILGISLNFFLLWFLQSFLIFHVRWLYQHWEGRRWKVLNQTIPPVPECWLELEHCFRAMDADGDGFVSKEDASRLVRLHLSQDLKEESWDKLLAELDRDQDAKLSLEEVEAIR
ncbi:unnamed protein product [Effrenium voratum]|nr:unnamed protein product [Effrenium voratum]